MSVTTSAGYRRSIPEQTRIVVVMPKQEADMIDNWAIPADMPSRTAAIRFLLRKGLEAVGTTETDRVA